MVSPEEKLSRVLTILLLSFGLWLTGVAGRCAGAESSYSEEAIKAAYLHRFAAYVEWPGGTHPTAAFTIGVMGSDGVLEELHRLLPAINVQGRAVKARAVKNVADLSDVSILYIGPGRLAAARPVIAAAVSHSVLVVTDDPDGLKAGGVINFVRMGPNVRFEVSQPAADRCGLKIDAALLGVAARVETR
jgi:hypothetical protein